MGLYFTPQLENDAVSNTYLCQIKDLELKLKESIADRMSLEETFFSQLKQLSEQVSSLEHRLQERKSQCCKMREELQQSEEEVCMYTLWCVCVCACVRVCRDGSRRGASELGGG